MGSITNRQKMVKQKSVYDFMKQGCYILIETILLIVLLNKKLQMLPQISQSLYKKVFSYLIGRRNLRG